ncbi:hypothetical protein K504DRAFT_283706 [Pleomassaria siparia CBS 279.74]|uniref:Uncharacterized protein n=1 Tax=Pleomassaria siparia CBS 279.74 TaxID=1314801 RepID=A0A6G1KBC5_9PLEO|nr:hypothetical protein K504DRAFT_283706 [Pleomassaria siparia CBS 279.74]
MTSMMHACVCGVAGTSESVAHQMSRPSQSTTTQPHNHTISHEHLHEHPHEPSLPPLLPPSCLPPTSLLPSPRHLLLSSPRGYCSSSNITQYTTADSPLTLQLLGASKQTPPTAPPPHPDVPAVRCACLFHDKML